MEIDFDKIPLVNNEEKKRFELKINGSLAFIDYQQMGKQVMLIHTEADSELKGTGTAKALVVKVLNYIEEQEKKVLPCCSYIFSFIQKNPDWKRVVDVRFKEYDNL